MTTLLISLGVILLLGIWVMTLYNRLVKLRNNRENAFADIDVQLKQRHDLIPQLVTLLHAMEPLMPALSMIRL